MVRILIPTFPDDVHAVEVALALRDLGHEPTLWFGSDFPTRQHASLRIGDEGLSWQVVGPELALTGGPFDVVWFRRPTLPHLPDHLHPGDRPVASRECRQFVTALWHSIAPDAFWVNPLASRPQADLKPVQLREAVRAGLAVPPTLISNDPARIREFLGGADGPVVYKPFYPAQWEAEDEVALLLTSEVRLEDLPEDEVLRLTPGIFQPRVPKAWELRVTYMGHHAVAARLLTQESEATSLDWRLGSAGVRVEAAELPPEVDRGCRRLMARLGIVFGCFDFIVTPEGRHVFLEVNPMGQFLWLEEALPELPLLARFCAFLAAGAPDFPAPPADRVRHRDYHPRAVEHIRAAADLHVPRKEPLVASDLAAAEDPRPSPGPRPDEP